MPVVLRIGGFSLGYFWREHEPPHVHVGYSGASVIVDILTGHYHHNRGMKPPDVLRAVRLVQAHQEQLLAAWTAYDQKRRNTHGLASD